jgi:tRNA dimethylallyltransferase
VPILVGGTGLYIRTLLDGIAPVPAIDPDVREAVRALPVAQAHAALTLEDPERAALLTPMTPPASRALEVVRSTGHSLAHWQEQKEGGSGMRSRSIRWSCCRTATGFMNAATAALPDDGGGAVAEVEALLARHLPPTAGDARHRRGGDRRLPFRRMDPDEAILRGAQAANYAKRQYTWLRHQPPPIGPAGRGKP